MGQISPFLSAGDVVQQGSLGVLHLRRTDLIPVSIDVTPQASDDYGLEGAVTNSRFGSFPHSTLAGQSWGSQVLASKVDTGSRGDKTKKRKRENGDDGEVERGNPAGPKAAVTAGTGFAHLLPVTPETWTLSLPHRTQVVYTSDYSYILQRLRATPGTRLIEAGAGSGSFTHAAIRAVYDGWTNHGHVFSFEYHASRVATLIDELKGHGLNDLVTVTHRDVYTDGFFLRPEAPTSKQEPRANAVFLDLPAPWMALRHLTRRRLSPKQMRQLETPQAPCSHPDPANMETSIDPPHPGPWLSPLDPDSPITLCTFTPCIEQVQSTVAALRQLGWVEIDMVEIQNRRLEIRRDRIGLDEEGLRGVDARPKDVAEAVERLRSVEGRFKDWTQSMKETQKAKEPVKGGKQNGTVHKEGAGRRTQKQQRQEQNRLDEKKRKLYQEGTLSHRTEEDIRNHTSYLVFAVLPIEWTEEDEAKAMTAVEQVDT